MMMESLESGTFYHDDTMNKSAKTLKSSMTLDFGQPKKSKAKMVKLNDVVLNSPDINMLKLASPELERLIIQQGGVMTAATPTTQILFPKSVTEEQEAYARGFVDALAELHKKPGSSDDEDEDEDSNSMDMSTVSTDDQTSDYKSNTYTTLTTVSKAGAAAALQNGQSTIRLQNGLVTSTAGQQNGVYAYTTVTQLPGSVFPTSTATTTVPSSSVSLVPSQEILVHNQPGFTGSLSVPRNASPALHYPTSNGQHNQLMYVKEEPQRVPSLSPQLTGLTPINMVAQEGIKLERKRARNRVAARKCRTRKLERISRLEDRVSELKGHNTNLVSTATELREQVFALKQQILEHVNSGCKVMLSANML